jgi:hypothetical protein
MSWKKNKVPQPLKGSLDFNEYGMLIKWIVFH